MVPVKHDQIKDLYFRFLTTFSQSTCTNSFQQSSENKSTTTTRSETDVCEIKCYSRRTSPLLTTWYRSLPSTQMQGSVTFKLLPLGGWYHWSLQLCHFFQATTMNLTEQPKIGLLHQSCPISTSILPCHSLSITYDWSRVVRKLKCW